MKFLVSLVIVFCAIGFSESISRKRVEAIMLSILDCNVMEDYVVVDMKTLFAHKMPKRYVEKCLVACLGEIASIIKDRRIDPDGVVALANKSYDGDSPRVEIARGIANACLGITDEERCEAAFKILECMHKDAESKGISNDDF